MVDRLKERIQQLISAYETERQERKRLETELAQSIAQNEAYAKQITELERTIDNLKLADAFKSGNADNTCKGYERSAITTLMLCAIFIPPSK